MSGPQFFETRMGATYYQATMPRIAKALEAIAKALEVKGVEPSAPLHLRAGALDEIRGVLVDNEGSWKENLSGADVIEAVSLILSEHGLGGR